MREIADGFAAHLAGGTTTLATCWRVLRRDGQRLGFTDHDRDLTFDGTVFLAGSGFEASTTTDEAGLAAPGSDVKGGFSSAIITEDDLSAGKYDGARVEVFRVNWAKPEERLLLKVQEIGDVSRAGGDFTAELRPFTHRLQQPQGRIYTRACGAVLGDAACGLALKAGTHRFAASLASVVSESRLVLAVSAPVAAEVLSRGTLTFTGGALSGLTLDLDRQAAAAASGKVTVDLWLPLAVMPAAGDPAELTAGCDKSFSTCRDRFGNGLNFQGFPHMPGADFAYSYADRETTHDGGALFP